MTGHGEGLGCSIDMTGHGLTLLPPPWSQQLEIDPMQGARLGNSEIHDLRHDLQKGWGQGPSGETGAETRAAAEPKIKTAAMPQRVRVRWEHGGCTPGKKYIWNPWTQDSKHLQTSPNPIYKGSIWVPCLFSGWLSGWLWSPASMEQNQRCLRHVADPSSTSHQSAYLRSKQMSISLGNESEWTSSFLQFLV